MTYSNHADAPATPFTWRIAVQLVAISLAVSYVGVLGYSYIGGQGVPLLEPIPFMVLTIVGATLFAGAAIGIAAAYGRLRRSDALSKVQKPGSVRAKVNAAISFIAPQWHPARIALLSVVMLLFWLPWAVALFPGAFGFDAYYQIYQCYPESHPISAILTRFFDDALIEAYFLDHHPIFDTLLFGAFGMASDALTGNWNLGIAVYVALQAAATACTLTASTAYLRAKGCPAAVALALYVFFCIIPFFPAYAFNMGKDSLFSLLYVPYFMMLFEIVRAQGGVALSKKRTAVLFVVLGILLCLTKKTGVYIVVPTALVAAVLYRRSWRPLLVQAIACLLVMFIILPSVVFPLLNVAPGGKQEPLGLLFQQTAAYAQKHPASSEEKAAIDKVLGYRNLREVYVFGYHDHVKWLFNQEATAADIGAYIKAWAAMGMRDPEAYLSAFMGVAGQYVAPEATINIDMGGTDRFFNDAKRYFGDEEAPGRLMVSYPECLDGYREAMGNAYSALQENPVLHWLLEAVVYCLWLPAMALFVMRRWRLRAGLLLVPGAIGLAFCLIGPVFDARYCLPLLYTAPLLLGMLCCLMRAREQGAPDERQRTVA